MQSSDQTTVVAAPKTRLGKKAALQLLRDFDVSGLVSSDSHRPENKQTPRRTTRRTNAVVGNAASDGPVEKTPIIKSSSGKTPNRSRRTIAANSSNNRKSDAAGAIINEKNGKSSKSVGRKPKTVLYSPEPAEEILPLTKEEIPVVSPDNSIKGTVEQWSPSTKVSQPLEPETKGECGAILFSPDTTVKSMEEEHNKLWSPNPETNDAAILFSPDTSVMTTEFQKPSTPIQATDAITETPAHPVSINVIAQVDLTIDSPIAPKIQNDDLIDILETPSIQPTGVHSSYVENETTRPLNRTFSPEPKTVEKMIQIPPTMFTPNAVAPKLRGIRKRSFSLEISTMKMNKSVCFHSPANEEMHIQEIDRIMEMSRIGDGNSKDNAFTSSVRRKRSLSNIETSTVKKHPTWPALTPRKIPDFKAIHQKNFDKMESIADYKNRREAANTNKKNQTFKAKSRIPTASNAVAFSSSTQLDKIKALREAVKAGQLVKVTRHQIKSVAKNGPKGSAVVPSSTATKSTTAANFSSTWIPLKMAEAPASFAFGAKEPSQPNLAKKTVDDKLAKRKAQFKGNSTSTSRILEQNKRMLNGVRSNRRFDLLMKFRQTTD